MTGDSLDLSAVRRRFTDSALALDEIRERLRVLAAAEESSVAAAAAIQDASTALRSTSDQLTELTGQVATAVRIVEQALAAAERFLQQTDLSGLTTALADLNKVTAQGASQTSTRLEQLLEAQQSAAQVLNNVPGDMDSLRAEVAKSFGDLEARLAAASTAEVRAEVAEAKLDALRKGIPARTVKKLGLTELQ